MKIYQLTASGNFKYFDGKNKHISKKCFISREEAEAHKETFKQLCCSSGDDDVRSMTDLDPDTTVISINELELVGM